MIKKTPSNPDQEVSTVSPAQRVELVGPTGQGNEKGNSSRSASFSIPRTMSKYQLDVVIVGAMIVLVLLIFAAVFWRQIAPHDPLKQHLENRLLPPMPWPGSSSAHILGTDTLGRDLLSNILYGLQMSLQIGAMAVIVAAIVGCVTGLVSGYFGGIVDILFMRFVDLRMAIPGLLIAMLIAVLWGTSLVKMMVLIAFISFTNFARVIRGETLSVCNRDFVEAAQAIGAKPFRIMLRHVLPNVASSLLIMTVLQLPSAILIEATLSFLGFGLPIEIPSLGRLVNKGYNVLIAGYWWYSIFPGLAILILVMSVNIIGDWLREYLDPRLREA